MKFLNQFICGDALATLKEIPTNSVDLVVTSPPYNLRSGGFMQPKTVSKWKGASLVEGYESYSDDMQKEDYNRWQREVLRECMRVLKDDGAIFYNTKWIIRDGLIDDRQAIIQGFPVRQIIIWQRAGGINFNIRFFLPNLRSYLHDCEKRFQTCKGGFGIIRRLGNSAKTRILAPRRVPLRACGKVYSFYGRKNNSRSVRWFGNSCGGGKETGAQFYLYRYFTKIHRRGAGFIGRMLNVAI